MNYDKKINHFMKLLEGRVDLHSPVITGMAEFLKELDFDSFNNLISEPDEDDFMKSLVLLAVALGAETRCREDIDKIYLSDEKRFFHFYSLSGIGKTKIFDKFSITTSEYIKKCYGIILSEEFGKDTKSVPLLVQRLIKKGYKPAFTFNMHRKWSVLEEFIPWFEEKNGGIDKISGIYLDRCCYVLMYLAYKDKKLLVPSEMLNIMEDHFQFLFNVHDLEEVTKIEEKLTTGYKELLRKVTYKNQISEDVSYVFENIRLLEEIELIGDNEPRNLDRIKKTLNTMPLTRITNALIVTMETFGLSADILRENKIGNKRFEEIAKYVYVIKNSNDLTEREAEILFLVSLVIYAISSEYANIRENFYEGLKVKMQEQEAKEEKRESELEKRHRKEIAILQEKLRLANETISSLNEVQINKELTVKQLETEQKRLNNELEKAKENDKEIQFLREFYFNSQSDTHTLENINVDFANDYLKSIKGVIVGGHPNLTKKLKEKLPNFVFVAETETSRNLSFLRNKDIVFISSVHDKHGLFNKVVKEISNASTILTYLEKYQNIDLLLKDMYEKCQEKIK